MLGLVVELGVADRDRALGDEAVEHPAEHALEHERAGSGQREDAEKHRFVDDRNGDRAGKSRRLEPVRP